MKDQPANIEHRQQKACICRFKPLSGLFLRPTKNRNAQGQQEVRCGVCGRTAYRMV